LPNLDLLLTGGRLGSTGIAKAAYENAWTPEDSIRAALKVIVMTPEFNTMGSPLPNRTQIEEPETFKWMDLTDKVATQISTYGEAHAKRAIDGNAATWYSERSCTHTNLHQSPWWQVDLGKKEKVRQIRIANRGDCCGWRLNHFSVLVDGSVCASNVSISQGETKVVPCEGYGQVMRVKIDHEDYLTICEFGVGIAGVSNAAPEKINQVENYEGRRTAEEPVPAESEPRRTAEEPEPAESEPKPYKAMVLLYLAGGADTFSMVVPRSVHSTTSM
jgi:hypothetical protein